ncbi:hydrocephalus-inducing protein-like [Bacillus rossius redtenbacheri]|uniref:hydrocephalus-inducing protein-like n=1 Tax=Bacillus rossius redtenbacheri TaxID=93214 RepID=UPI002FDD52F6
MESDVESCDVVEVLPTQERFSQREIFSLFLGTDIASAPEQVPPCLFMQEMLMTTEQRNQKLAVPQTNSKYEKLFGLDNVFRIVPRIILFQCVKPGDTSTVALSIRNAGKMPRPLRMASTNSPNFQINYKSQDLVMRVAPGLSAVFEVKFLPDEFRDYKHEITFFTELSKITVPVYAIGPRPLLDFPDSICMPSTAVKISSTKSIIIRNMGEIPAVFVLSTERPFVIHPERAILAVGELMQVIITFTCFKAGSFAGKLNVNYETGERLVVSLHGTAKNDNIELSRDTVQFQDTFVGLKRQDSVTLHNAGSHVIQFKWLSASEEKALETSEESGCEENLFSDPNFSFIPQSGEVWPGGSVDTTLIFEPKHGTVHEVSACCEVTGRESCIALTVRGRGLGPRIALNLESLDVSFVFLGSVQSYEVVCANKGDICGTVSYAGKPLLFGGELRCSPASHRLAPGETRAFVLSFCSNHSGDFSERIAFLVQESLEEVAFTLKGRIINPTLHFTISELNLGEIPIGFVTEKRLTLCNKTLVPVVYSLKVKSDGNEPSITFEEYARMGVNKIIPTYPQEFTFDPMENVIEPSSCTTVKLFAVPNIARHRSTSVLVTIHNSEDDPASLPLTYVAAYPHIIAEPSDLTMECFINFPYNQTFTLVNDSNVIGYFYILPQKVNANNPITYSFALNESVIKPKSRIDIPVTIITSELGVQSTTIKLLVMGAGEAVDLCRLTCTGRGPVVSVQPDRLRWGVVDLLQPSTRSFSLANDSPVPAPFRITVSKRFGRWTASPDQGVVGPNSVLRVDATAILTDVGKFSAKLSVQVGSSLSLEVRMEAQGEGTSIVADPSVVPELNLGTIFSHQTVERQILLKNEGTKHHQLQWSFTPDVTKAGKLSTTISKKSNFEIITAKMSLLPEESSKLTVRAKSERAETVREELYCAAVIDNAGKSQLIYSTSITADFVDPLVVFSKPDLVFCTNVLEDEPEALTDTLQLANQTILPLTVVLQADAPFHIASEKGDWVTQTTLRMEGLSAAELEICFDPTFAADRHSKVAEGFIRVHFEEHPQKVKFPLRGEVNFPNVKVVSEIDFGCISVGTNGCKDIMLQNVSPLPVDYSWSWMLSSSDIVLAENEQDEVDCSQWSRSVGEPSKHISFMVVGDTGASILRGPGEPQAPAEPAEDGHGAGVAGDPSWKSRLFQLVAPFHVEERDAEAFEVLPVEIKVPPVLKYFEVTPHRGHLEPYESTVMWVSFFGEDAVTASVGARCSVRGGATETVRVSAAASRVTYRLSRERVDFGSQVFLKKCQDVVVLWNPGNMPFDFAVRHGQSDSDPLHGMFGVEPMSGHLPAGGEIALSVTFLPGASGKFVGEFHLEIAYLNPVAIRVEGFGSIPQLYVDLPRPALLALPEAMGYKAISAIENGWHPPEIITDDNLKENVTNDDPVDKDTVAENGSLEKFAEDGSMEKVAENGSLEKVAENGSLEKVAENGSLEQVAENGSLEQVAENGSLDKVAEDGHTEKATDAGLENFTFNKCFLDDKLMLVDWVLECEKDSYPSVADTELAVERLVAYKHLVNNPHILLHIGYANETKPIPELYVPPYTLDVGAVIAGTEVSYAVLITNSAPSNLYVKLAKMDQSNSGKEYGFSVGLSKQNLSVGGSAELLFTWKPPVKNFSTNKEDFSLSVILEVAGGANIAITTVGFITVPSVVVQPLIVDFDTVKTGFKRVMAVVVKNEGWVPCIWKAEVKPQLYASKKKRTEVIEDTVSAFTVNVVEKCFDLGVADMLEISFTPFTPGDHKAYLVLTMQQNPIKGVVVLQGNAVEPKLAISETEIEFPPCLPYQQSEERQFTITNPCTFPVEVFLTDLDSQLIEEERVLEVLFRLYETKVLVLPERTPGDKLPYELLEFYQCFLKSVRDGLRSKEKLQETTRNSEEVENDKSKDQKKIAPDALVAANRTTADTATDLLHEDPLALKTDEEIFLLIDEYLGEMKRTGDFAPCGNDPLQKVLASAQPELPAAVEGSSRDGVLIVFHGAPLTESVYAAHKMGKTLGIPVLNIDQIILEQVVYGNTVLGRKVYDLINTVYKSELENGIDKSLTVQDNENQQIPEQLEDFSGCDSMEEIVWKVAFLEKRRHEKLKPLSAATGKGAKRPKSGGSKPSSQRSPRAGKAGTNKRQRQAQSAPVEDCSSLAGLPLDLLRGLMAESFRLPGLSRGLVVESLRSTFLPCVPVALTALLAAAGNVAHILGVVSNYSPDSHYKWLSEKERKEELEKAAHYQTKLEMFENLDDSEIDMLEADDQALYDQMQLDKRRKLLKLRIEAKQKKQLEKKEKQDKRKLKSKKKSKEKPGKKAKKKGKSAEKVAGRSGKSETKSSHSGSSSKGKKKGQKSAENSAEKVASGKSETKPSPSRSSGKGKKKGQKSAEKVASDKSETKQSRSGSSGKGKKLRGAKSSSSRKGAAKRSQETEANGLEKEILSAFGVYQSDFFEIISLFQNWDKQKGAVVGTMSENILSAAPAKKLNKAKQEMESQLPAYLSVPVLGPNASPEAIKNLGIPVWVMNCTSPETPPANTFVQALIDDTRLQDVFALLRKPRELLPPEAATYLYVLRREPRRGDGYSSVFPISPVEPVLLDAPPTEEVDDSIKTSTELESARKSERGKLKKTTSKTDVSLPLPSTQQNGIRKSIADSPDERGQFSSRWVLPPGGSIDWKVAFEPRQAGEYSHTYTVGVTAWDRQYSVTSRGTCGLPDVSTSPQVIFPQVSETVPKERTFSPTYFIENDAFDLGSVITSKPKDKNFHQVTASLNFENVSLLPATINFSFLDKITDKVDCFTFEPSTLFLEPGKREVLKLMATPHLLGLLSEVLVCSIKNNPKVHLFKIICSGARIEFEVDVKNVVFGPSLLYRKDTKIVTLKNKSPVALLWRFFGTDSLKADFEMSVSEGVVIPYSEQQVHITYTASKIQTITKKPVRLEVFLDETHHEPALSELVSLSAETYDVVVDVKFPPPGDDHLDFGASLVGQEQQQALVLRNKGKYDISFKITRNKAAFEKYRKLKDMIVISPDSGVLLHSKKPFPVQVKVKPQEEIQINKTPTFNITILQNESTVVAIIPIQLSMTASYANFVIEPLPEINFGPLVVTSKESLILSIKNIGSYEFRYIVATTNTVDQPPTEKKKGTGTKKIKEKKKSQKKGLKNSSSKASSKADRTEAKQLTVGMFVVSSSTGTVASSESVQLPVECVLNAEGVFQEKIFVHIFGSRPEFKGGVPVQLMAQGCLPTVDYKNIENIFREHYICESIDSFEHRNTEAGGHCIFSKEDETLWFRNVCVGTALSARLRLSNPGLVPSLLHASAGGDPFSIGPQDLAVTPLSTEVLTVTFAPSRLETYTSKLEVVLEMPPGMKSVKMVFRLHGESCIPEVRITAPGSKTDEGNTLVAFEPTILEQVRSRQFSLCNAGAVPCKVFMELPRISGNVFSVHPVEDSMHSVLFLIKNEPVQNTTIIALNPGESAAFSVSFQPREAGLFEAVLKLYVVDNPFENMRVVLRGRGYREDVTLEGANIEPLVAGDDDEPSSVQGYHLDLGRCNIVRAVSVDFKVVNHCGMSTYRFEWKPRPNVKIVPHAGHLAPSTSTDCVFSFSTSEPVSFDKVAIECVVAKINILDVYKRSHWDSQQVVAKWSREVDSSISSEISLGLKNASAGNDFNSFDNSEDQRVVLSTSEPEHEVVAGSARSVFLLVSVTADYAKCACSVGEVLFKDTLMFKNRVFELELVNTGVVPADYEWVVTVGDRPPALHSPAAALPPSLPLRPLSATCSRSRPRSGRKTARPLTGREPLVDTTLPKAAVRSSDASASSPRSIVVSSHGDDYIPFSVEPGRGVLMPGETLAARVTFSPFDTHEHRATLECLIPGSDPGQGRVQVALCGRGLMPYCHLEVEQSDYLSGGRRDPALPSPVVPLESGTCTVELAVLGVGATCTKEFYIVNPTEQNYAFFWRKDFPSSTNLVEPIVCHTPHGFLESGKKIQVSFSFTAADVGVFESFWTLTIPLFDVQTLFLLVGIAKEPSVYFLKAHVNLQPTVKGVKTQTDFVLVNDEDIALSFNFVSESLFSDGRAEKLNVQPVAGVLSPMSEQKMSVDYVPAMPGERLFSLKCKVEKLRNPLEISVLAMCYSVEPLISWQDVDCKKHKLHLTGDNVLDFKEVSSRQSTNITFRIVNSGKISFCYQFKYDEDKLRVSGFQLQFTDKGGRVAPYSHVAVTVSCTAFKDRNLDDFKVYLEIRGGPTYRMRVRAKSVCLHFQFSFSKYDFGPCIIQNQHKQNYKKELVFKNNEETSSLLLECKYESTPHLDVSKTSRPVPAGQSTTVSICFSPVEARKYCETIVFVVNGSIQKEIQVSGEGTELKVLLVNSQHRTTVLGALQAGQVAVKHVPVVNKSKVAARMDFCLEDPPADLSGTLKVVPSAPITMQPGEVVRMSVIFAPTKTIKPFSQNILMQCNKQSQPLFTVKGSCVGYEFVLDRTYLTFGAVTEGCSSTLKLVLSNVGDLGSRFSWKKDACDENFTITPETGYCSPGCVVTFTVVFHPRQQILNIRSQVQCEIENHSLLSVVLSGSCVAVPQPKEAVNFVCAVRQRDRKNVTVSNKTSHAWQLYPQVSGDFFSGADILTVPPRSTEPYEVTYAPLTMTHDSPHSGSVLFCLPDGTAVLHALRGSARPPPPEARLARDVSCKTDHAELLPVTNWLQRAQRFAVATSLVRTEKYDPLFSVSGSDYLDVPGNSTRDYRLVFNVQRECVALFKVTFTNEDTGDFQFYELTLKVGKCGPLMTIQMKTFVRVPTSYKLSLKNPLPQNVVYAISCSAQEITYPAKISVPAKSLKHVTLEYLPLLPGDSRASLEAVCGELGSFPYELQLQAAAAPAEKPLSVAATLGSSVAVQAAVRNYSRARADFTCSVNHDDFYTEKILSISSLSTGSVKVTYEPSNLGNVSAVLTVSSPTAGEFVFPLVGKCLPPKPQGPLELRPGVGIAIPFKNVFQDTKTFNMAVDNPVFILKNPSETVKSKKETKINVGLQPMKHLNITDTRMPVTGKLTLFCSDPCLSSIVWTYYLKGILE